MILLPVTFCLHRNSDLWNQILVLIFVFFSFYTRDQDCLHRFLQCKKSNNSFKYIYYFFSLITWLTRIPFPALSVGYECLLWVLIGSLYCVRPLWLAKSDFFGFGLTQLKTAPRNPRQFIPLPLSSVFLMICSFALGDSFFRTAFGFSFSIGPFCLTNDKALNWREKQKKTKLNYIVMIYLYM